MRERQLQPLVAGVGRAARRERVPSLQAADPGTSQRVDRRPVHTPVGDLGRADALPAAGLTQRHLLLPVPGRRPAPLPPGVPQRDAGHGTALLDDGGHPGVAVQLGVVVDPCTTDAGAPLGHDGDLLREHEAEASGSPGAEVHHVEGAVDGPVPRHRRHPDAVAQRHALERELREQDRHEIPSRQPQEPCRSAGPRSPTGRPLVQLLWIVTLPEPPSTLTSMPVTSRCVQ